MTSCFRKKVLTVNECGERQVVEQVGEVFPHVGVPVLTQALIVETVHLQHSTPASAVINIEIRI